METREELLVSLKALNVLISSTNKQLEGYRLLHDGAALIENHAGCDTYREYMHAILDISLDQTAQQQRVLRLISKLSE